MHFPPDLTDSVDCELLNAGNVLPVCPLHVPSVLLHVSAHFNSLSISLVTSQSSVGFSMTRYPLSFIVIGLFMALFPFDAIHYPSVNFPSPCLHLPTICGGVPILVSNTNFSLELQPVSNCLLSIIWSSVYAKQSSKSSTEDFPFIFPYFSGCHIHLLKCCRKLGIIQGSFVSHRPYI